MRFKSRSFKLQSNFLSKKSTGLGLGRWISESNKNNINRSSPPFLDLPNLTAVDLPFLEAAALADFPPLVDLPPFEVGWAGGCHPDTSTSGKAGGGMKLRCLGRILRSSDSARRRVLMRIKTSFRSSGFREREKQLIISRCQLMLRRNKMHWAFRTQKNRIT